MGWHPVLEALETGKEFQRVMIQRDEKGERTAALMQKLHALNIPVQRVPKEKLLRITAKKPPRHHRLPISHHLPTIGRSDCAYI
jgi:tRNA G18 (ribose-2'-O)-methylase SpoU